MSWLPALQQCVDRGDACVLVSVMQVEGSAPRDVGARLLVQPGYVVDTIGGGRLEHDAVAFAQHMLEEASPMPRIEQRQFSLGQDLAQCCGGRVTLLFDYLPASHYRLVLFGAGHIAQALLDIVQALPLRVQVHDARESWLDRVRVRGERGIVASRIGTTPADNPVALVEHCAPGSAYLVMTHSHDTDFEIVQAILARGDSVYCGLVASRSKAASFRARLARQGFSDEELARLSAPIGTPSSVFKQPMAVAVAAAQAVMAAFE